MQFRKSTTLFLAILILFSNLGLAINVHYCKDKIVGISLITQIEEICVKEEISCCKLEESHHKCCSNKVIKAEEKSDNILSTLSKIDFKAAHYANDLELRLVQKNAAETKKENLSFHFDSHAPPIYKLYCQLVLYA